MASVNTVAVIPSELQVKTVKHSKKNEDNFFQESTHSFLLFKAHNGESCNLCRWLLGLFVLIIQFILYFIIIVQGVGDYDDDQVNVNVTYSDCYHSNGKLTDGVANGLYPQFVCEAKSRDPGALYLAMILSAIFLQYDYLACFKIIFFSKCCDGSKLAALLILCEAITASIACAIFSFNGWYNGTVYDAIMNTIGVLFIHDIDEKVFESVSIIIPSENRFSICCCFGKCLRDSMKTWCTFIFIAMLTLITATPLLIMSGVLDTDDYTSAADDVENI